MKRKEVKPDELVDTIMDDLLSLVKAMAVESSDRIIDKMPVATGALRGSVNAGLNTENISFGDRDPTGERAKQNNRAIISGADVGDEINIVIGAPYFHVIEKGSDSRAPMGILLSTGEEHEAILNRAKETKEQYK